MRRELSASYTARKSPSPLFHAPSTAARIAARFKARASPSSATVQAGSSSAVPAYARISRWQKLCSVPILHTGKASAARRALRSVSVSPAPDAAALSSDSRRASFTLMSAADARVNVTMSICSSSAPPRSLSMMRSIMTVVLPLPAPADTITLPSSLIAFI